MDVEVVEAGVANSLTFSWSAWDQIRAGERREGESTGGDQHPSHHWALDTLERERARRRVGR
jgi:hypothetical protein